MEKIKTVDAIIASEFVDEVNAFGSNAELLLIDIEKYKLKGLSERYIPIQPISQIIAPSTIIK